MNAGAAVAVSAAVAAALLSFGCAAHWPVVHNEARHRSVVVLGDSLALGVGAQDPNQGFVAILFRALQRDDPSAQIDNYATRGATVSDVLASQLPAVRELDATDVWICVGGNDVTHETPTDRYAADEQGLLSAARGRWPGAHMVVFGVPDVARAPLTPSMIRFHFRAVARHDNDAARDAARASHADFVDLFRLTEKDVDPNRDLSPDYFHPNDSGYSIIANEATRVLR